MQLQIECNQIPLQQQSCLICKQLFQITEAKVLACSNQGDCYGEVCPNCLHQGFGWLSDRFDQLNQPKKAIALRKTETLNMPIGA